MKVSLITTMMFVMFLLMSGCDKLVFSEAPKATSDVSPVAPSMSLYSPTITPSVNPTPTLRISGVSSGDTISIYSDSACTQLVVTGVASGSMIDLTTPTLATGSYYFHVRSVTAAGRVSSCSSTSVPYQVGIAGIQFSRDVYSMMESGSAVGSPITLVRGASAVATSVDLTIQAITADSNHVSVGTQTVSFGANDTSITVTAAMIGNITNSAISGDLYFRMKLSNPTNGVSLGDITEARVNYLDEQTSGEFFFAKDLQTVKENDGSINILVQRAGSTAAVGSVEIGFHSGSANAGTHFDNSYIYVPFSSGESEKTISVPIIDNSTAKDNSSFYLSLKQASGGILRTRPYTKVRILDNDEVSVCDESATPFGGGDGSLGNPYQICAVAQLDQVRNFLNSNFRVMKDLNLSGFAPLDVIIYGRFDGNEFSLKNFSNITNIGTSDQAFISYLKGSNAALVNLNLEDAIVQANDANSTASGMVGTLVYDIAEFSNNFFSGKVQSGSNARASGLINMISGQAYSLRRNFMAGVVRGGTNGAGGLFGTLDQVSGVTTGILASDLFSTATVSGDGEGGGGILGYYGQQGWGTPGQLLFDNVLSSGVIMSSGNTAYLGGIVGYIDSTHSSNSVEIFNSSSSAQVRNGNRSGGFVGFMNAREGHYNFFEMSFSGQVIGSDLSGSGFGQIRFGQSFSMTNIYLSGVLKTTGNLGGLAGILSSDWMSNAEVVLENINSTINADGTGGAYTSAGVVGILSLTDGTDMSVILKRPYFDGRIQGERNSSGLIGQVTMGNSNTLTIAEPTVKGLIQGRDRTGGLMGRLEAFGASNNRVRVNDSVVSAEIQATGWDTGGLVGSIYYEDTYNNVWNFNNSKVEGKLSGQGNTGGLFGVVEINSPYDLNLLSISRANIQMEISGQDQSGGVSGAVLANNTGLNQILFEYIAVDSQTHVNARNTAGGFFGLVGNDGPNTTATIQESYTHAPVTGDYNLGGFAGQINSNWDDSILLNKSYSASVLTSSVRSIFGLANVSGHGGITPGGSYWLKESGINDDAVDDPFARTRAQLLNSGTYSGWDFATVWNLPTASDYPTLK